jgi:hypothetical protein
MRFLYFGIQQRGKQFIVGDLEGNPGKSLVVELEGSRAGMWMDFALYPLQYHIDIHKLSAFRGYHGNPTFQ